MATPSATGLTIADLEAAPEDTVIRHLIDGDLYVVTPPTIRHQRVVARMFAALLRHADAHGGEVLTAPTGVRLSDRDMPEPDVLYVRAENLDRLGERYVEGAPDLVVEVSSRSTRRLDIVLKRRQYERFGVEEYWFVDLDADHVAVYRLGGGRYGPPIVHEPGELIVAAVIDGLEVRVEDLFPA